MLQSADCTVPHNTMCLPASHYFTTDAANRDLFRGLQQEIDYFADPTAAREALQQLTQPKFRCLPSHAYTLFVRILIQIREGMMVPLMVTPYLNDPSPKIETIIRTSQDLCSLIGQKVALSTLLRIAMRDIANVVTAYGVVWAMLPVKDRLTLINYF